MNCVIPGCNIKVVSKAIQALTRISEEIFLEGKEESLSLLALNANKTAYVEYTFLNTFFVAYSVKLVDIQASNNHITCRLQTRALAHIFKPNMEQYVDYIKIMLDENSDNIKFVLEFKNDARLTHTVHLLDSDYLNNNHSAEDGCNCISNTGQFFSQIFSNFEAKDANLSLVITKSNVTFRNYDMGASVINGMRSQISTDSCEFLTYDIKEATNIVTSLKALRSCINFAEKVNLQVSLHFRQGGLPIIASMKSPNLEVKYILATISPDDEDSQDTRQAGTSLDVQLGNKDTPDSEQEPVVSENFAESEDEVDHAAKRRAEIIDIVFGACLRGTHNPPETGKILVPNSDPEDD